MCLAGGLAGAAWAAIPAVLRAFFKTNEIITSLMLNYVAGLVLTYLIIDSLSYWRDTESFEGQTFPLGKVTPDGVRPGRRGRSTLPAAWSCRWGSPSLSAWRS